MTTTVDARPIAGIGMRALLAACLAVMLLAANVPDLYLVLLAVIVAVTLDGRNPLALKNFFLVYTVILFGVGAGVLHYTKVPVFADVTAYIAAFLCGYRLASLRRKDGSRAAPKVSRWKRALQPRPVEAVLVALIVMNLAFLLFQFSKFGLVGYYRGQALLDQFLTYGQASATGGIEQIVRFLLKFLGIGMVVLYAQACFESSHSMRYRYLLALLVGFPILALHRFDAVTGAITAIAIYGCERRVTLARGSSERDSTDQPPRATAARGGFTRAATLGAAGVSALAAALAIGVLRQGFGDRTGAPAPSGGIPVFASELSPVQAYGDIKANIGVLGHPHGKTIVLPLLFKVLPRAWLPNKPLNSGAYYMKVLRPAEFAAGYALPPTFFGDAYLSFGFSGALALCLLLGIGAARLDVAYTRPIQSRVPFFLVLYANSLSLMRDPLSESLAGILLSLGVWLVANHLLRTEQVVPQVGAPQLLDVRATGG